MMVSSVVRMRDALEQLRNSAIADVIPTEDQFNILSELDPVLDLYQRMSESLSCDKTPTIQFVCHYLFNITEKLKKLQSQSHYDEVREFITVILEEQERRFPSFGTKNHFHAMGNFLNPYFKGQFVKKFGNLEELKSKIINSHPSRQEFISQVQQDTSNLSMDDLDQGERFALELSGEGNFFLIFFLNQTI